ncbi:hypothetical protein B9479_006178 [Cryptococcus floricola]|uniref:Uncharacterized protein n=1 Tax=Cryptococcus floricola TaxID=2591691 RepID=A0A5D3AT17_9TREE|nr:hypothetical protein B9479_006178 [Cryptococcus floricola]
MSTGDSAIDTTVSNDGFYVRPQEYGWKAIQSGDFQTSQYRESKNNGSDISTAIQLFGTIDGFEGIMNIEITDLDHEDDLDNQSVWTATALKCFRKPGAGGELYEDLAQAVQETYYYASDEDQESHRKFIRKELATIYKTKELATIYKTFVEPNQSGASSAAASPEEEDTVMED